jgi:hypothetical protein
MASRRRQRSAAAAPSEYKAKSSSSANSANLASTARSPVMPLGFSFATVVRHCSRASSARAREEIMERRMIFAVTIAAAQFGVVTAPALAQNSESSPAGVAPMKPKTPAGGTVTVKVTNWREADLVELQVVESGSANWKKVLGAVKAGQWTWAKVPQGKNCHVDLRGKYADGKSADVSNVDICADKSVDLVN